MWCCSVILVAKAALRHHTVIIGAERIGLVTGDATALKHVFQFMTEKTYEFPVPKDMAIINGDRHKQVSNTVENGV